MSGVFITIEGIDGAGKSTLANNLADAIREQFNLPVLNTREPGGTPLADDIRSIFKAGHERSGTCNLFLVAAARASHRELKIAPWLADGGAVVCDRYTDSTRVYQGIEETPQNLLDTVCKAAEGDCRPHLTFIVDLAPEEAQDRLKRGRGLDPTDRYDHNIAFQRKAREGFLALAYDAEGVLRRPYFVLDGTASVQSLTASALFAVGAFLDAQETPTPENSNGVPAH